jgi:hypothetical protein
VSTFPDRVHKNLTNATRLLVGRWLAVAGAAAIAFATLTPHRAQAPLFNPLCILCGESGSVDLVLNLLLFVPLGVGLALAGSKPIPGVLGMFAASLTIELLQAFVIPGRDPTIRDVITNSTGGALGFAIGAYRQALIRPRASLALKLVVGWSFAWLVLQTVAAYSLVPTPTRSRYYGQIGRELGEMLSAFPGEVRNPTVDGVAITDSELSATRVRPLLSARDGAPVQAAVIQHGCPRTRAGIVRIADAEAREILILAQSDADLDFGVRTGAETLRLRPVRYRLRDAFGQGSTCAVTGDTILLQARYARMEVFLRAAAGDKVIQERLRPSMTQSWRLLLPVQTYVAPTLWGAALTAIWLFILMLPAGYWGFFVAREIHTGRPGAIAILTAFVSTLLTIAFVAVPALLGIPAPRPWEWLAALSGALVSIVVSRRVS